MDDTEQLRSYDVKSLFTSVPVDKAIELVEKKLRQDTTLTDRTNMNPSDIAKLLTICLNCTYFVFDGQFYRQIHGAPMGSPGSPLVCNLYMEAFEESAISTAPIPSGWWLRYVDDTNCKINSSDADEFTQHLNSVDPNIQLTTETESNGELAFLDTCTVRQDDGSLRIKVYRKPTHTDQYLNWESNHPLEHKMSVVRTLFHRANTVPSHPEDTNAELEHVKAALKDCGYPEWALQNSDSTNKSQKSQHHLPIRRTAIVIPYVKGLSEELRRTLKQHGVDTTFKPYNTLRQLLSFPKDPQKQEYTCGPIYRVTCQGVDCGSSYVGETERTLKSRFAEHLRPSSASSEVSQHIHRDYPGHKVEVEVLDHEDRWIERGIKEAIYIRVHRPDLNRDTGRYLLPHIWDNLLRSRVAKSRDR